MLAPVKLLRLDSACLSVLSFSEIKKYNMGMKLGRRVAVHGARAVVLELGANPFAGCLGGVVPAHAGLDKPLHLVQGNAHTLAVSLPHPLVTAHKRRERDALRRAKGSVPAGAVLHRLHRVAVFVLVLEGLPVSDELLAGLRVLAVGKAVELFLADFAFQAPLLCEPPVPLTAHLALLVVVSLLRAGEFFRVVRLSLARAEGLGNGQHGRDSCSVKYFWLPGLIGGYALREMLLLGTFPALLRAAPRGYGDSFGR